MNNIALLGYGTVGKGVKDLLDGLPEAEDCHLVAVFDLPEKEEELGKLLVTDPEVIMADKSIDTVIECLGGDELPYRLIKEALTAGKNVISSNKETISKHLKEYLILARDHRCYLQFEASVGGGIPLLYPLYVSSSFDTLSSLEGILNGTTNFILTQIQDHGMDFATALKKAQELGFAEKDPTADLEGLDMVRKGNILASLCYQVELANEDIPHFGISHLSPAVLSYAKKQDKTLRFVVDMKRSAEGLGLIVIPELFPNDHLLSQVKEETNAVVALFERNGPLTFIGKGAGRNPTASAILQDVQRIIAHCAPRYEDTLTPMVPRQQLEGDFVCFPKDASQPIFLKNPVVADLKAYDFVLKEN
jgi:homoserine dehydrogenase